MNLISKILNGPPLAQLRERVVNVTKTRERLATFASRADARRAEVDRLRDQFFASLTEKDFTTWQDAAATLPTFVECCLEVSRRQAFHSEAALETDSTRELLLAAFKSSAASLSREVNALAEAERQRLADAGVEDEGENPALAKVRARIKELSECYDDLEARAEPGAWHHYKGRYFAALSLR